MSSTGRNLPGREINALGAYDTPRGLVRAVVDRLAMAGELAVGTKALESSVGSGNWIRELDRYAGVDLEAMDVDPLAPGLATAEGLGHLVTLPGSSNRSPAAVAWADAQLEAMKVPSYRRPVAASGFLVTDPQRRPDIVIGNPPYSVTSPRIACPECNATGRLPSKLVGRTRKCPACNRWPAGKRPKGLELGHQPEQVIQVCDLHVHRALQVTRRHVVFVLRLPFLGGRERFRSLWSLGNLRAVWTVVGRPSFAHGGTDSVEAAVFWWDLTWDRPTWDGSWITWED